MRPCYPGKPLWERGEYQSYISFISMFNLTGVKFNAWLKDTYY